MPCVCGVIEEEAPRASHEEWCLALVTLSTIHHTDMQRTFRKYKTKLRRVLELAEMPARYGWYANNAALRSSLQKPMSTVVATGTTGNEALHSATAIVRSGV